MGLVQHCINFEVIGDWILCQRKAEEGSDVVPSLTDDNAAMAQNFKATGRPVRSPLPASAES